MVAAALVGYFSIIVSNFGGKETHLQMKSHKTNLRLFLGRTTRFCFFGGGTDLSGDVKPWLLSSIDFGSAGVTSNNLGGIPPDLRTNDGETAGVTWEMDV